MTTLPARAFMAPFQDVGKLRSTSFRQPNRVVYGSDPFAIRIDGRSHLYHTYGPTLPKAKYGGSPGIYHHELAGELALEDWEFEGVVLRPSLREMAAPGFEDFAGVECFTATPYRDDWIVGLYHGYSDYRRMPSTVNKFYAALIHREDPRRVQKVGPVLLEEDVLRADPRLSLIYSMSEPSIVFDEERELFVGCLSVDGVHDSATPPSEANPKGGKAGRAWRTHLMFSTNLRDWFVTPPVLIPNESYGTGLGANMVSHGAVVLDEAERVLHVFAVWSGNWGEGQEAELGRKGILHAAALLDEWPLEFHRNPNGDDGRVIVGGERLGEDHQIGGPAPLLRDGVWELVYHADNKWFKENGTAQEKEAIAALETSGRRHMRLARSAS
jgi:hypothetical protein